MKIENTVSNKFEFELLSEFENNPNSIEDFASLVGEKATALMVDTIQSALRARNNNVVNLPSGPLTIQVSVAIGNSEDFGYDEE